MYCTVLLLFNSSFCDVLYCTVLQIQLYCTVLYCTVLLLFNSCSATSTSTEMKFFWCLLLLQHFEGPSRRQQARLGADRMPHRTPALQRDGQQGALW
jgi:hypothetical protein